MNGYLIRPATGADLDAVAAFEVDIARVSFGDDAITDAGPERGIELFHGYTYSAHPVACAAGLAMIDIFAKERLIERAAAMGPYFADAVHALSDLRSVSDIRSFGMLAAVGDGNPTPVLMRVGGPTDRSGCIWSPAIPGAACDVGMVPDVDSADAVDANAA